MKRLLIFAFALILFSFTFVSAEMYVTQNIILNNISQTADSQSFYRFDDTSPDNIGNMVPLYVYVEYVIPDLSQVHTATDGNKYKIDWCDFCYARHNNNMDYQNLSGDTSACVNYTSATNGVNRIFIVGKDVLQIDMTCHYNDSRYIYEHNDLGAVYYSVLPSFVCNECSDFSYQVVVNDSLDNNPYQIYDNIDNALSYNFQFWTILEFLIKIVFVLACIGLSISGIYYLYVFVKSIERSVK